MPFVIDNSVISGWYLEDQATPYAEHIATRLVEERACAPALWELELTDVLRTGCLRRRLTAEKAQQILSHIAGLPIDTDRHAVPRHELLALALRFGLSTLGEDKDEVCCRVISPAHAGTPLSGMGAARRGGRFRLDGILFPSQACPGGINLVVYRSSTRPAAQLRVYDPDGTLQKIAPRTGK